MSGANKRPTLDWVPVSLKSKSWNWPGRFATAARFVKFINLLFARVEKKRSHLTPDGHSHWLCCNCNALDRGPGRRRMERGAWLRFALAVGLDGENLAEGLKVTMRRWLMLALLALATSAAHGGEPLDNPYGTCDQQTLDEAVAIARLPDSHEFLRDHPRGLFAVLTLRIGCPSRTQSRSAS